MDLQADQQGRDARTLLWHYPRLNRFPDDEERHKS